MQKTVDLLLSYAAIGRPVDQEPKTAYHGVPVWLEETRHGQDVQLLLTLDEPLKDLPEFNQAWVTFDGQTLEGVARYEAGRNRIVVSLYHDQGR